MTTLRKRVFEALKALCRSGSVPKHLEDHAMGKFTGGAFNKLINLLHRVEDKKSTNRVNDGHLAETARHFCRTLEIQVAFLVVCAVAIVCEEDVGKALLRFLGFKGNGSREGTIAQAFILHVGPDQPIFNALQRAVAHKTTVTTKPKSAPATNDLEYVFGNLCLTADTEFPDNPFDDIQEEIRTSFSLGEAAMKSQGKTVADYIGHNKRPAQVHTAKSKVKRDVKFAASTRPKQGNALPAIKDEPEDGAKMGILNAKDEAMEEVQKPMGKKAKKVRKLRSHGKSSKPPQRVIGGDVEITS